MDDTTKQMLIRRVRTLRKQVEPLLADLRDAERALDFLGVPPEEIDEPPSDGSPPGPTMKEMAIESLQKDFPDGATCAALVSHFRERYGRRVGSASLSSQLAKLGKAGILTLDGALWSLTSRGAA